MVIENKRNAICIISNNDVSQAKVSWRIRFKQKMMLLLPTCSRECALEEIEAEISSKPALELALCKRTTFCTASI